MLHYASVVTSRKKGSIPMKSSPIHYVMWRITTGGVELSINHYIDYFWQRFPLYAYSLRTPTQKIYDENKIHTTAGKENNWSVYLNFFLYCRKHKSAIFHLLNGGPIILLLSLLAGVRNPIYHIRGTIYWDSNWQWLYLKSAWLLVGVIKRIFPIHFIANSNHSAKVFHEKVLAIQPEVIYNGINTGAYTQKRVQRRTLKNIGYAGRLHEGKNVELVLQLFASIADQRPELQLHIAGEGPLRKSLQAHVTQSPFSDRIHIHGFVKDMPNFFASLDLLLFMSAYESFGNVLVEALLTGLPILTSDIPVFNEIHGGENDFTLGDPSYYETLHTRFLAAIENYETLSQKAMTASHYAEKKFNIDQHLAAFHKIYSGY